MTKNKKQRKTFKLPTEGPLYESDDEWAVASPDGTLFEAPGSDEPFGSEPAIPTPAEAHAQQLEMIRNVFAFEKLAWKGFQTILVSILFFATGTSLAGGFLGWAFPNYCRFIFGAFDRVDFKPWIGGLAHGLVLGALAGAVIGCVVVASVALYQSRSWKNLQEQREP
jgi:hypothetical protein